MSVLFDKETLEMRQILFQANSLNITSQVVINAVQPVTPTYYEPQDLSFPGYTCVEGSQFEQDRVNYYITRIVEIFFSGNY